MRAAKALRSVSSTNPLPLTQGQWSWGTWSPLVEWTAPGAPPLRIHQPPSEVVFSSGFQIWPASSILAGYLIKQNLVSGARILEIGAGTGALGLACAAAGAKRVVLTERAMDDNQPSRRYLNLLEQNAAANAEVTGRAEVLVDELDFQKEALVEKILRHGPFDLVIGCEMMYDQETHPDLASALSSFHSSREPGALQTFLCHNRRDSLENLEMKLGNVGLDAFEAYVEGEGSKFAVVKVRQSQLPALKK